MWIRPTKAFNTHPHRFYLCTPYFKPKHACAVKPEVLISWTLEIDYSRAPCLGADQKTRGLWERDCIGVLGTLYGGLHNIQTQILNANTMQGTPGRYLLKQISLSLESV